MRKSLTEIAAKIVEAQLMNREMSSSEVQDALRDVFSVLTELSDLEAVREQSRGRPPSEPHAIQPIAEEPQYPWPEPVPGEAVEKPVPKPAALEAEVPSKPEKPNIPPEESIQKDKIICLECGREFKQLTHLHLKAHGLKPREYKQKHGLPPTQALTATRISEERSRRAREMGLAERSRVARGG